MARDLVDASFFGQSFTIPCCRPRSPGPDHDPAAGERGWSQEDLAHEAGLHRTFIGHVERQARNISVGNVKRIAQRHHDELAQRIDALQAMQRTLDDLLCHCPGDDRPDCPILDDLAHL